MIVLMGGSGSTGSSLTKNILNRHPFIFAGEETNLFCKPALYSHFQDKKEQILRRGINGLPNKGWHLYRGVDLFQPTYDIDLKQYEKILNRATSFKEFANLLEWHFLLKNQQKIWLEKTPANAAMFTQFLSTFEEGKVVHMCRHPLDTIASLIERGYNLYYAIGIYLLNTGAGLATKDDERSLNVKYEDIVTSPKQTIENVCNFLGVEYFEHMTNAQNENIATTQLEGWKYDETGEIGQGSVGRFQQLKEGQKSDILYAIQHVHVNEVGQKYYGIQHTTIAEIAKNLGYTIPDQEKKGSKIKLKLAKQKDRLIRIGRMYKTGFQYPLSIQ